uniref:Hydroxyacid dehydrogenase n=1 Tax=Thermofilum pendens TaxID=2269 RepID=A0A7C3WJ41_THEPE
MDRVFVALRLAEWERRIIDGILGSSAEVVYMRPGSYEGLESAIAAITFRLPGEALSRASRLRFVQVPAAGVDQLDVKALAERGVTVASAKGCNARAVAEHAFALLLALAKKIVEQDNEVKRGVWRSYTEENFLVDLEGATLAVVGYGSVGREVARLAKAFGMRVLAVRKQPRPDELADFVGGLEDLPRVLSEADFVVVALPLTEETRGLIGERELRAMKKGSFLINVGRGAVVDERALYRALSEGWIAGAGLDVWWRYPPEEGWPSPLGVHKLPNVIATPHKAGWTRRAREACLRFSAENVLRFLRGEEPLNVVRPEEGY